MNTIIALDNLIQIFILIISKCSSITKLHNTFESVGGESYGPRHAVSKANLLEGRAGVLRLGAQILFLAHKPSTQICISYLSPIDSHIGLALGLYAHNLP